MSPPGPEIHQGDVWRVAFFEGGERPAVVLSRDALNRGRLVLVAPCTTARTAERRQTPNHVLLPVGTGGVAADCVVQTHLIQPVEAGFLMERLGALPTAALEEVLTALAWTTGLFEVMGRDS